MDKVSQINLLLSEVARIATSNDQRDNNPLDIGAAARVACEKYSRDMSLSKFSEMVGIDNSSLAKLVQASNVAEYIGNGKIGNISNIIISNIKDKSFHLAEISQAPKPAWIPLVRLLSEKENTVSKMRNHVKMVKQLVASVPDFMMPSDEIIFDEIGCNLPSEKDKYIQSLAEIAIRSQPVAWLEIRIARLLHLDGTILCSQATTTPMVKIGNDCRSIARQVFVIFLKIPFQT